MRNALLTILTLLIYSGYSQCTYTDLDPFPNPLIIKKGEVLCVTTDAVVLTDLTIKNGGNLRIYNGSTFRVNGIIDAQGQATIHVEDCDSKLEVFGTYTGANNRCEIYSYCDTCDLATGTPYELLWGSETRREWCCQAPLKVELGEFHGVAEGLNNFVYFQTYSEINVDYFVIQRSIATFVWQDINSIPATNTNQIMWYSTVDANVNVSYYYRLKEVETSGVEILHPTIRITREVADEEEVFRVNILGQHVDVTYHGLVYIRYTSGRVERVIQ
jgi:hypothetical protein